MRDPGAPEAEQAPGATASRNGQLALARAADERGDVEAALTHLAAACALGGAASDWLALGERLEGEAALRALASALDALDEDDIDADDEAEIALGVGERASAIGLSDLAQDALGTALLAGPSDDMRRRFLRAARAALEPDADGANAAEVPKVGRNEPCPCGSGVKYKRCHGASTRPAKRARASDDGLLLRLALPHAATEDATRALDVLRRWVPRSGPVNVMAGIMDAARGERDEARRELRLAARAAADDLELHHDLLRALGRIVAIERDLALEILDAAPVRGDPVSLRLTGALWLALGLPKAAAELLRIAVQQQLDPAEREATWRALAAARVERGDHEGALRAIDEVAEPRRDDLAQAALWAAWARQPSLPDRVAALREAGWTAEADVAEGVAALVAGENSRAAELLDTSISAASDHWLAEAFDALGADLEAREARRDCTAAEPAGQEDLARQVECLLALDGPEAARAFADRHGFVGLQPIRAIARVALRLGDVDDAREGIGHLLDQAPRGVETLLAAAEWRAGSGDIPAALAHLDDALAQQPKRHRIRFARAELLRQVRRTDEALAAFEELAREEPRNWCYRVALAELCDEMGEVERSRAEWRAAHRLAPDAPSVARAIGRIEGEDNALARAREEAERSVRSLLGEVADLVHPDARAALVGAEQDWRSLPAPDDHSTVVTQLAKALEIELMRRVFAPFRPRGAQLADAREDVGGFGKWCRGQITSLSIGEMAFAIGSLARDDVSPLLREFRTYVSASADVPWDLGERLGVPLRLLTARRNAAVHKEPVSRAEAEDSRRAVLGHAARRGIVAEVVTRFAGSA